ncbi:MAG: glycosyltransferase [Candidatus Omnitrophica bacterium]|nr:glycosyltransferase [Candidatus Omnitrophota bacterium]
MEEEKFISVIIPTYNQGPSLLNCINALKDQTYTKSSYEIIIINDGSTDETDVLVKSAINKYASYCTIVYLYQQRKGPAAARNLGIKHAQGTIIASIDSDCIAIKTWLEEITKWYSDSRLAGVGGLTKPLITSSIINEYCSHIRLNDEPYINRTGIEYIITGNASFRKEYLILVGLFDERYTFPGGEDPELCYRLKKAGYYFQYNKNAVVFNPHKQTLYPLLKTYYHYGKGGSFLHLSTCSVWSLTTNTHLKFNYYFIKALCRAIIIIFDCMVGSILDIVKFPLKTLLRYGNGLSLRSSLFFSLLDNAIVLSYRIGMLAGYWEGKRKGIEKST